MNAAQYDLILAQVPTGDRAEFAALVRYGVLYLAPAGVPMGAWNILDFDLIIDQGDDA